MATQETEAALGRPLERPAPTFSDVFERITRNVQLVIQGKPEVIELALVALVAEGHLLIEDVPGVGKTSLAKALAASIDCTWGRVQFTPDLLPSDVMGVTVWNRGSNEFDFRPGPIFANIVLGDEINRASPKTQSALLEAMEERQVTVDGTTYPLDSPFIVIATQNPIDHEGTYPLPESQLDRFLLRVAMGYPDRASELEILDTHAASSTLDELHPVATAADVARDDASSAPRARRAEPQGVPGRPRRGEPSSSGPRARHVAARHAEPAASDARRTPRPRAATTCCPTT